ncbi:adhesion G protein-coupled receptor B2 [Trichonephila clavipes]|nr:adhesion G protein-coupled receptor B2 [Trichonephila clavipes]
MSFTPNAAVLFVDVAIQPEVRFIAKQNSLMKIGNNGNLVLGPFDESTPCLMIVLMNCQTKLRINHLTAVKSVAISERYRALLRSSHFPNAIGIILFMRDKKKLDLYEVNCTRTPLLLHSYGNRSPPNVPLRNPNKC